MTAKNQKTFTDEHLVLLIQKGDQTAMGTLYNRYFNLVYAKCLSFTKNSDDANDLTQNIMIKVLEKIQSFKGTSKFSTWLYAITVNYCTDEIRKLKGKHFSSIELEYNLVDESSTDKEAAEELEYKKKIANKALASISKEDEQLLVMKYQLNKSIKDLQNAYNLSASAVKMRLLRARSKAIEIYSSFALQPAL